MKPWLINTILIICVLIIVFAFPSAAKGVLAIIILITSIWAYFDAKKLDIKKYQAKGFLSFSSPFVVLVGCWLLWIIVFPLYISYRKKIKDGKIALKETSAPMPPAV